MNLADQIDSMASLIADKTKNCLASIHIDAGGLLRLGITNAERLSNFNQLILKTELLGGTVMIPAFSYTYPKEIPFNLLETPSEVGFVTEYLRKNNSLKRTADGMFSYLLFDGNSNSPYFDVSDYEIFGDDSLIGEIFYTNGYIGCVGGVFHNTPTEVHFLERLLCVPYRSDKIMSGEFIDRHGKTHWQNLLFFCRDLNSNLVSDMTRLETSLHEENLFEYWQIDGLDFSIEVVHMKDLFDLLKIQLEKNPLYLCSTPDEKRINLSNRRKFSRLY